MPAGCHLIDDDLSVCGVDYLIDYKMRLTTEIHMTIEEKLSLEIEKPIADALRIWADPIFSGRAHDLDMCFYALDGTNELKHHQFEVIDATQKSYTLTIPRQDYQHLAVVNTADNGNVSLSGSTNATTMRIEQREADTLPSHPTAIYTARLQMHMSDEPEGDLSFDVPLYMISSAVALVVIDSTETSHPELQSVTIGGTATGFNVLDSTFTYSHPSVIRAQKVTSQCYAAVTLPSADKPAAMRGKMKRAEDACWTICVHTRLTDGSITETVLDIKNPLQAGTLEIIKVYMHDDGTVEPSDVEVGVTVTLDWKQGSSQELITG